MKLHPIAAAFIVALLFTLPGAAKAMPILIVENGELLGANNVDVNGTLFDVRFRDGSCISLFSGCDNASEDFVFTDAASAEAAARALRDQVFFDGVEGNFDTSPELSAGCSLKGFFCDFLIPYGLTFSSGAESFFHRTFGNFNDDIQPDTIFFDVPNPRHFDWTGNPVKTFAVFTLPGASAAVPEPGTLALFGLGLAGLGFARRKRMWRRA